MKLITPTLAFLLFILVFGLGLYICFKYFGFILLVVSIPLFAGCILVLTIITQLILFLTIKFSKKEFHRFFFFYSSASCIGLIGLFSLIAFGIHMLVSIRNSLPEEFRTETEDNLNPIFNFYLILLIPTFIQIILIVVRKRKTKEVPS